MFKEGYLTVWPLGVLRGVNGAGPLTLGEGDLLSLAVGLLEVADLIDVHDERIRIFRQSPVPVPAGSAWLREAPIRVSHDFLLFVTLDSDGRALYIILSPQAQLPLQRSPAVLWYSLPSGPPKSLLSPYVSVAD